MSSSVTLYCKSYHLFGEDLCMCVACVHLCVLWLYISWTSGQKIQSSVERMFRIWRDRKVYDKVFVKQLDQLLAGQSSEGGGCTVWSLL